MFLLWAPGTHPQCALASCGEPPMNQTRFFQTNPSARTAKRHNPLSWKEIARQGRSPAAFAMGSYESLRRLKVTVQAAESHALRYSANHRRPVVAGWHGSAQLTRAERRPTHPGGLTLPHAPLRNMPPPALQRPGPGAILPLCCPWLVPGPRLSRDHSAKSPKGPSPPVQTGLTEGQHESPRDPHSPAPSRGVNPPVTHNSPHTRGAI